MSCRREEAGSSHVFQLLSGAQGSPATSSVGADAKKLRRRQIHSASAKRMRQKRAQELKDATQQVLQLQATTQRLQDEADKAHRHLGSVYLMVKRWQELAVQERRERQGLLNTLEELKAQARARGEQERAERDSLVPQGWCFPQAPAHGPGLPSPRHSARSQSPLAVVPGSRLGSPGAPKPLAPPPGCLESFPDTDLLKLDLALPCSLSALGAQSSQGPCFPAPSALQSLPQVWELLDQGTLDPPQVPLVPETPPPSLKMAYPPPSYLAPPESPFQVPTAQHGYERRPSPQPAMFLPQSQAFAWQQPPCYRLPPLALPPAGAGGDDLAHLLPASPFELACQSDPCPSLAELAASFPGI